MDKRIKARDAKYATNSIDQALDFLTVPKRYKGKKISEINITSDEIARAVKMTKTYIENFKTAKERGASGFMAGGVGTGKTMLACIIVEHVIGQNYRAKYTTAWSMIQKIRSAYNSRETNVIDEIRVFVDLDLLVIDEIGVQHGTDDERVLLNQVVDGRYNNVAPTIIISNSQDPVSDGFIDLRTIDRLNEGGGFSIKFRGESYRR